MIVAVKVKPNARQNQLRMENDAVTVRIQAPPHDGEANDALIRYLADLLDVPKSSIRIVSGHGSRMKRLEIPDCCKAKLEAAVKS